LCLWKREQVMSKVVQIIAVPLPPANFWGVLNEGGSEYLSVRNALSRAKLTECSGDDAAC
jgi:hypothetical protein